MKNTQVDWTKITKQEFQAYEEVRASGVTNMWNITLVKDLSGIDRDTILSIMEHYSELEAKYPGILE